MPCNSFFECIENVSVSQREPGQTRCYEDVEKWRIGSLLSLNLLHHQETVFVQADRL